jgi:hypothetical protein
MDRLVLLGFLEQMERQVRQEHKVMSGQLEPRVLLELLEILVLQELLVLPG